MVQRVRLRLRGQRLRNLVSIHHEMNWEIVDAVQSYIDNNMVYRSIPEQLLSL